PENVEAGKPLRYSATIDILPKLEVRDFDGLPAKRPRRAITEQDVDRSVEHLRERLAELRPVEEREQARAGDFVLIDYDASIDGKPLPEGKRENRLVELGKGSMPPEIDAALEGMSVGETKTVDVEFPKEYPDENVAGRSGRFVVSLRGIRQKVLPPADDELAKEHGECATLAELREKLREQITQSFDRQADEQVREQLIDELVRRNPFDVPRSLVERQVDSFIEELLTRIGEERTRLEKDAERLEKLRAEYRPSAERQVRAVLLLDAFAEQNGIDVGEDEVERRIDEMAARAGERAARFRELYREPDVRAELRSRLARERALERITAAARIEPFDVTESVVAPTAEKG
ncbi:MAG: trigger factor, partial [Candidatus Binatia bacterium]